MSSHDGKVFAGGNSGLDGCATIGSPGDSSQVITVGNTDARDFLNVKSSTGPGKRGNFVKVRPCPFQTHTKTLGRKLIL